MPFAGWCKDRLHRDWSWFALFDRCLVKHEGLKHICVHHEQSAAFAAIANAEQRDAIGLKPFTANIPNMT